MRKQRFYHRSKDKSNGVDFDTPFRQGYSAERNRRNGAATQPKGLFLFQTSTVPLDFIPSTRFRYVPILGTTQPDSSGQALDWWNR